MQIPIKKTLDKIPGGMMVVPLFLGVLTNTFFPQFLNIGGFTTGLFGPKASTPILACFMFLIGSQINFKLAPKAIKKGAILITGKFIVGAGIGIIVGKVFGPAGVLGLSPLAILAALTNCNGGLYASLASQYGDETDVGAYAVLSLKDGPFFTLVALGASGLAQVPFKALIAVLIPIVIGMILGNIDSDMRKFLGSSKLLLIPFFSFPLGAGMNLETIVKAGGPGILLGVIAAFTGIGAFILLKLFKEEPIIGLATGSTAGNAVATPAAVAAADPTLAVVATVATAQVAAACVVSAIICPFVVTYAFKMLNNNKMKKAMKLKTKLTLLVIIVVFVSISIIIFFVASWMTGNIESKARTNIMNVAEMVAHSREIIDGLETKDPKGNIGPYVNMQLKNLEQIEYIIVADREGIRYSHPNPEMIGKSFAGGDQYRVAEKGETYISEATGTLGKSLRAFAPIYDAENKREIGFVCVGTLTHSIETAKHTAVLYIILIALGGLSVGMIGAFLLANNIKNTLLGLEPEEITRLYNEKMGILGAIHEGLVAVDQRGRITLINNSALNILRLESGVSKEHIIGQNIEEVIPNSCMINVLATGECEFEREQRINNTIIMVNRIPIMNRGKVIGAIASFRDKTEVTRMAEELTGIKKMAWSLRAQNHEFMNKLHTISGLIQLEEYDEALQFITDIAKVRNNVSDILTKNIKDAYLSALLFSKYNKAEECRVKLKIDENSKLTKLPQFITSEDMVSLVGNLIENSLDAVKNDGTGEIFIRIVEKEHMLYIVVKDNGSGIPKEHWNKIYEQGFSTKEGQRGHGMYIVKQIIDRCNGTIEFKVDKGVFWNITIPMTGGETVDRSIDY